MTEAEFYLLLIKMVNKRRLPFKQLSVGWSESSDPCVMLEFQKIACVKIDDAAGKLWIYAGWLEKAKEAAERMSFKNP